MGRVLAHGPRAGPGQFRVLVTGPGRAWAWTRPGRAGPGPEINYATGPGLGWAELNLGRAGPGLKALGLTQNFEKICVYVWKYYSK